MKLCIWWTGDRKGSVLVEHGEEALSVLGQEGEGGEEMRQSTEQSWSGAAQGRAGQGRPEFLGKK